jgi:hypothetical protein
MLFVNEHIERITVKRQSLEEQTLQTARMTDMEFDPPYSQIYNVFA